VSDLNYTVELVPPDIEPYRAGNTGIEYVTAFEAKEPGPHVVVTALTHGNEICGAIALDRLFRAGVRPRRGRLSLAFNNVAAYHEFDPRYPIASRYVDEDFNRLWSPATLDGPRQSMELARARRLRPLIDSADLLLDLHSMQYATAPLMLAGLLPRSRDLALRIGIPELIMCDAGHAAGPRMRDYGGFGDPGSAKTALLIECGQHWERRAAEVATDQNDDAVATLYVVPTAWVKSTHCNSIATFGPLPPGRYRVSSWHARLPGSSQDVTLNAGSTSKATVTIGVNSLPKVP